MMDYDAFCITCGEGIILHGTFGLFGEVEPTGFEIEGIPYCFQCGAALLKQKK